MYENNQKEEVLLKYQNIYNKYSYILLSVPEMLFVKNKTNLTSLVLLLLS